MNLATLKLKELLKLAPLLDNEASTKLNSLPTPEKLCGAKVPESLDHLTMGQLIALQSITADNCLTAPARIILALKDTQIMKQRATTILAFNRFASEQMVRIAQMFDQIPSTVTPEMRRAGVDKLNFGIFGMVDSYARRMGITNHDYVLECVGWLTVYQCIKNDAQTSLFEKRLREITAQKK